MPGIVPRGGLFGVGGALVQGVNPKPLTGASANRAPVTPGYALFTVDGDDKLSLRCELGDTAPLVTQGYGGWEEVDRPGRTAITTWRGFRPIGIDLPVVLDQFADDRPVDSAVQTLEALAGRGELKQGENIRPPLLAVDTAGVMPHDAKSFPDTRWVISDLDFDEDTVLVDDDGRWTRVAAVVSLLQYVADDTVENQTARVRQRIAAKGKPTRGRYTVKQGDTLVSIAPAKLGDPGRWQELADLNDIRDPRAKLKTGRHMRLPR